MTVNTEKGQDFKQNQWFSNTLPGLLVSQIKVKQQLNENGFIIIIVIIIIIIIGSIRT